MLAYEELVRKVHTGKVSPDDFAGVTVDAHQPGHARHGAVGSAADARPGRDHRRGRSRLPGRVRGRRPRALAEIGVGQVVTLTSTYDHRIIQGAESGLFLAHVAECLTGEHGFYDEVFESMDVPVRAGALAGGRQAGGRRRDER